MVHLTADEQLQSQIDKLDKFEEKIRAHDRAGLYVIRYSNAPVGNRA